MPPGSPALISRLQEICGREFVLTGAHELATYRSDALLHHRQVPLAAVLPGTGEQVRQVVQACFQAGIT
ncbi:MAG: FAD-binding oxidoreductase, partial [Trebonia sp.]